MATTRSTRRKIDPSEILVNGLDLLIDLRDADTGKHCLQVGAISGQIAKAMGLTRTQAQRAALAGRVHDLGKIAIPDRVLRNSDELTEREIKIIRNHAEDGERVLLALSPLVPAMRRLAGVVVAHHERWNGQGYPRGLAGTDIPLEARVVAVADAYSAITMKRPYEAALEHSHACDMIKAGSGTHFDPDVVAAFLSLDWPD